MRLNFTPDAATHLEPTRTGQALDGDLDGKAGGVYDFWFNSQTDDADATPNNTADASTTVYVDKLAGIRPTARWPIRSQTI